MKEPSRIETLEPRIAPASVSVTYTDVDGDLVKITASKPGATAPPLDAADLVLTDGDLGDQLKTLTLTDTGFDGARITFKVTKGPDGDGLARVGFIDATGVDLDKVIVKGDLGRIVAGDGTRTDPGLNLLQTRTMGTLALVTQGFGGSLVSDITGKLGALKVAGDFTDANLEADQIGLVFIGGDLTGGVNDSDGRIYSVGAMGDVRIGGNVTGGVGARSGSINTGGSMGDVRIGGDVTGGAGENSGTIVSGPDSGATTPNGDTMGDVRIGGSLTGGVGIFSGRLGSTDTMGDVKIGGSVTGGSQTGSGQVVSVGSMGHVRIGGNLIGGSITGDVRLSDSGEVTSFGRIASVTIGGSFIAGSKTSLGTLIRCGAIVAGDDLGPVKIGGSILGNFYNPALIIAEGQKVKPATGFDTAIASLTVGGDVRYARILGGFYANQASANADASIGRVTVGADWVASNLLAGAEELYVAGIFERFSLQSAGDTPLIAHIASIMIRGDITGSFLGGDHFGFVAQQIDKLKIGPHVFPLAVGPGNNQHHFSIDLQLLEVSEPS